MNSTIWFWYTMLTAMFPPSSSGHISVGPKTMPKLCVDIRFLLENVSTLSRHAGEMWLEEEMTSGPADLPEQVAEEHLHRLLVGLRQLLDQLLHCLQFAFGIFDLCSKTRAA